MISVSLVSSLRARRSFFLTPASRLENFSSAPTCGADALILDLESTVAPSDKERARAAALAFLRQPGYPDLARLLRINSLRGVEGLRDLLALRESGAQPDALVLPKCESADELRVVLDVLDGAQSAIGVVPMVELACAVFVAHHLARAHSRVCGLFFGGGDLAADLGAEGSWEYLLFARSQIVAAAATAGIAAIDVPYFKKDSQGLERDAAASRKLGMTGKAALHADQLPAINAIFAPSADAVIRSRSIKAALAASNGGVPVLNGHAIEPALVREAERVLAIDGRLRPDRFADANSASPATARG